MKLTDHQRAVINNLVGNKMDANNASPYSHADYTACYRAEQAYLKALLGDKLFNAVESTRWGWNWYGNNSFADDAQAAIDNAIEEETRLSDLQYDEEQQKVQDRHDLTLPTLERLQADTGVGWRDSSWVNDACDSLCHHLVDGNVIKVWLPNPQEGDDLTGWGVVLLDSEHEPELDLGNFENYDEVLAAIKTIPNKYSKQYYCFADSGVGFAYVYGGVKSRFSYDNVIIQDYTVGTSLARYSLTLGNDGWLSDNIEPLEQRLFARMREEGYSCDLANWD